VSPVIVHKLIASLACRDIEGETRLLYDLDIVCWVGDHVNIVMFCTIPGIIIYIIVIPLFFLWITYKNRQNFKDFKRIEDFGKAQQFRLEVVVERYGFFQSGLKENFWYWDIVVIFKKFGFIFSVEYLRTVSNKM